MAKLKLTEAWHALEVGDDCILTISKVEYKEKLGRIEVFFKDAQGGSGTEIFKVGVPGKKKTRANEVALSIFSTLAKAAMLDWNYEEIDPLDLVAKTVKAEVYVQKDEDSGKTYVHAKRYRFAPEKLENADDDFDDEEEDDIEDEWDEDDEE